MFGEKLNISKKFKGLGCINCPNNRFKKETIRNEFLINDSKNLDLLFVLTEDNEKLIDIIDENFSKYKIGVVYLTQCEIEDLKPTSPQIDCCKKNVQDLVKHEIKSIKYIVTFNSHALRWIYSTYYDASFWRGNINPVNFCGIETWNCVCVDYNKIKNLKEFQHKEYWQQLEVDFKNIKKKLSKKYVKPVVYQSGYEDGIEVISGMENRDYDILKNKLEYFKKLPIVALDIENTPLKPWQKNKAYPNVVAISCISIGTFDEIISFPLEHPKCWGSKYDKVLELLEDFLLNSGVKICFNLKHELQWFYYYFGKDVLFKNQWKDAQALSYVLRHPTSFEKNQGMHGLGKLTLRYFGFNVKELKEVDFKKMFEAPIKDLLTYCGRDSKWTYKLSEEMLKELPESQEYLFDLHNKDAITWAISEAEGYSCNRKTLNKFEKEYTKKIKEIEKEIFSIPHVDKFDLNSSEQLARVFKKVYDIELPLSDKNQYKTDVTILNKIDNELSRKILKYRGYSKSLSTYISGMKNQIHLDGKFHSEFNSLVLVTGRKSSNNPNAQNFPKRKNVHLRNIVIPEKDCIIVSVDYGQLEARGYCMASNERSYIEKIKNGEDIHMYWAERILELYPSVQKIRNEKDLKDFRSVVKNLHVFPSFYGAGIYSRARNLQIPVEIMREIDEEFWSYFPCIRQWQLDTVNFYRKYGYVETLTGRRLRKGKYEILGYNDTCNHPIQGTCSDIVDDAANRLAQLSYEYAEPGLHPTINIHDDLTFMQIPKSKKYEFCGIIMKEMCRKSFDFMLDVPLQVEVSVGNTWGDMQDKFVKDTRDFNYV